MFANLHRISCKPLYKPYKPFCESNCKPFCKPFYRYMTSSQISTSIPVIVVSGVSSDVGKTSIAVGIMAALHRRGLRY
jgi:formylmethanofuran:tetrahydromethanopterin formyltransferase